MAYQVHCGDARAVLATLPEASVDCAVTSPPYWSLRKYEGEQSLVWGGKVDCEHEWGQQLLATTTHRVGETNRGKEGYTQAACGWGAGRGRFCQKCTAWFGALGLEPTPQLYIAHLVEIFQAVRRVLKDTGCVWLNSGDTYAGSGCGNNDHRPDGASISKDDAIYQGQKAGSLVGIADLNRCLIPQRLAIALQEDGWFVRQDVVWAKTSAKPESVDGWRWEQHRIKIDNKGRSQARIPGHFQDHSGNEVSSDAIWEACPGCPKCASNGGLILRRGSWRPTTAHEYVLMLTKTDNYYADKYAVREPYTGALNRWGGSSLKKDTDKIAAYQEMQKVGQSSAMRVGGKMRPDAHGRNLRSVWKIPDDDSDSADLTSLWEFPTKGFPGAHFAVFPQRLPELAIKASTSEEGNCSECGAPWVRVIQRPLEQRPTREAIKLDADGGTPYEVRGKQLAGHGEFYDFAEQHQIESLGFKPTCDCDAPTRPTAVLDPFMGAGTTLLVAEQLGRDSIGIDISPEYCTMAIERIEKWKEQHGREG